MDKNSPEWRHQCEVRELLRMRVKNGKAWLREYLSNPKMEEQRRQKLVNDIWFQWSMGHRGDEGLWFD